MSHFHVVSRRDFFFQREGSYEMPRIQNVTIGQETTAIKYRTKVLGTQRVVCVSQAK